MKIVPQGFSSSLTDFQYNFLGKLLKPACGACYYSQFTSACYGTFQINPVNSWYVFPTEDCSMNPNIKTISGFSRWDYGKIKIAENVATVSVPDNNEWRLILLEKMLRFRMEMETKMEDTAAITKMTLCAPHDVTISHLGNLSAPTISRLYFWWDDSSLACIELLIMFEIKLIYSPTMIKVGNFKVKDSLGTEIWSSIHLGGSLWIRKIHQGLQNMQTSVHEPEFNEHSKTEEKKEYLF